MCFWKIILKLIFILSSLCHTSYNVMEENTVIKNIFWNIFKTRFHFFCDFFMYLYIFSKIFMKVLYDITSFSRQKKTQSLTTSTLVTLLRHIKKPQNLPKQPQKENHRKQKSEPDGKRSWPGFRVYIFCWFLIATGVTRARVVYRKRARRMRPRKKGVGSRQIF